MVSLYSFDNFLSSQYTVATIDMSLQVYGGVPIKVAFDSGNSTFSSCLCTSLGVQPFMQCIFCLLAAQNNATPELVHAPCIDILEVVVPGLEQNVQDLFTSSQCIRSVRQVYIYVTDSYNAEAWLFT